MTQPLSLKFIEALAPARDHLYSLALATTANSHAAENLLIQSAGTLFQKVASDSVLDIPSALESSLPPPKNLPTPAITPIPEIPMPADVWARLTAAIQIEAARSTNSHALNPDSVLLRPDPLLAPKKAKPRDDLDFDLSSPSRIFFILGTTLLVAVVITIYILTRPAAPRPSTHPASPASQPAEAP